MRKMGLSLHDFVKIGLAASVFILVAKFVIPKANVPALTSAVEKI